MVGWIQSSSLSQSANLDGAWCFEPKGSIVGETFEPFKVNVYDDVTLSLILQETTNSKKFMLAYFASG